MTNTTTDAKADTKNAFDPMAVFHMWTNAHQTFAKMMGESSARAQAWSDEVAAMETQLFTRMNAAIDQWAQLAHDSLTYTAQLSAQARKLGVEAARKAGAGA
jgi:hypothetical protein